MSIDRVICGSRSRPPPKELSLRLDDAETFQKAMLSESDLLARHHECLSFVRVVALAGAIVGDAPWRLMYG